MGLEALTTVLWIWINQS